MTTYEADYKVFYADERTFKSKISATSKQGLMTSTKKLMERVGKTPTAVAIQVTNMVRISTTKVYADRGRIYQRITNPKNIKHGKRNRVPVEGNP